MILLDTDIVSHLMRSAGDRILQAWLTSIGEERLAISTISIAEISFGIERIALGRKRLALTESFERVVALVEIISVDPQMAAQSGVFRAARESVGRPTALADSLIAATAHTLGICLATRNVRDFDGLGLQISNPWA